jgi:MoxR-like ATPase
MQDAVPRVRTDPAILDYVIDIAEATRNNDQLHLGISPRGALALTAASQASAILNGRDYVIPDDVKQLVIPVCAHRVISKSYLHNGDANTTARVLKTILDQIPTPR